MPYQFFIDKRPHNGMNYREYIQRVVNELAADPGKLSNEEKELLDYKKLNMQRSSRIERTYDVSGELESLIKNIKDKQIWMVITEGWCGDSAQILPYIVKMAEVNSNIDLRILLRDSNPDIMELYLTNGTKSIPRLVVFDTEGNELFTWGPRPKVLQSLIHQWKIEGIVRPELYEKLHLWYSRDKGKEIEAEFTEILKV
ncbi:MAG: thioredoxin family protein [Ignavibacteriaceae bacterium]